MKMEHNELRKQLIQEGRIRPSLPVQEEGEVFFSLLNSPGTVYRGTIADVEEWDREGYAPSILSRQDALDRLMRGLPGAPAGLDGPWDFQDRLQQCPQRAELARQWKEEDARREARRDGWVSCSRTASGISTGARWCPAPDEGPGITVNDDDGITTATAKIDASTPDADLPEWAELCRLAREQAEEWKH